jgi:hypothetical protein
MGMGVGGTHLEHGGLLIELFYRKGMVLFHSQCANTAPLPRLCGVRW